MSDLILGSGGGGCFLGHTLVRTPKGQQRIDELKPGDQVLSFDDRGTVQPATVLKVHEHESERVVRYRLWGGNVIDATPNHWVLNQFNAFVEIGTLGADDCLVDENNHLRPIVDQAELCIGKVYNLTVEGHHTFIAGGIRVHNAGLGAGISGSGGGGGKGGGGSYNPSTARDGLDSVQYAQVIDLISEGEIQGLKDGNKSIFINNTPLQNLDGSYNFQNVAVYTTTGTQSQAPIPLSNEIASEFAVGTTVLYGLPVIKSITKPNADAARITISVPQLQGFTNQGDIIGASVQLQIAVQYAGGGFAQVVDDIITGRSGDLYQKNYLINFTGPRPVDIRVTRAQADSTDPKLVNAFSWASYTEITYAKLRYPNSALVGLRIDAEQFSSIPSRSYLVRGIKVKIPNNATVDSTNGRLIYSGIWDGTFGAAAWTTDPCFILYDLLTSTRYGFGDHIQAATLDKWSFYSASQYASTLVADGFGGYEPRFSCNCNIQTQEDAFKLINDLCSVFRAQSYWSAGSLTVSQDAPKDSTYLFTLANVTEDGFTYQNSSKKTRPTVAVVSYLDISTREIAYEASEDKDAIAKYGVITTQISAFACTSRGQASRIGKWLLFAENYESEIVSFTASIDAGVVVRPGQVIEIADPMRAGSRRGGRISSATTTVVNVDDATGLTTANSPTLSVILSDGTVQTRAITNVVGNAITLALAFTSAPLANSIWIFESTNLQTSTWRVLGVAEQDQCQYAVTAIAYNSSKYSYIENGAPLQVRNTSNLNAIPAAPTNFDASETLYRYQDQVRAKVIASWKPVVGVNQYEVRWRKDLGNWTIIQQPSVDFEVLDITPGLFEFKIYSLNAAGKPSSTALTGSITALGKIAPPSDVQTFAAALDPSVGVTLTWTSITDLDLQGYEIWQGSAWGSGTQIGLFNATSKKLGLVGSGTTTWWIKALDTSGIYSSTALGASLTITAAPAPNTAGSFAGENFTLSWTEVAGSLATSVYEVRYGTTSSTWATAASLGTVKGTTFSTQANWGGTRRFFVAAIDLNGTTGASNYFDAIVTLPIQPVITQQVIDNNVLLQWTDSTQTLPIVYYELRKGTTWAGATVIGTKQGKFTSVFETTSGTYVYWLAGIDSAGNYGTPGSISAQVNQPPDYVLKLNVDSTFSGTKTNLTALGVGLLASVNTTETWQSHFTSRGWNTPQDQINAGYPFFAMPSATTGQYYEDINYGTVLAGTKVAATLTSNVIAGATTITPSISVKKLVTDAWTVYAGVSSVFATDFQYARIQYDFASAGGDDLLQITGLNIRLDSKIRNDSGNGTANAADSGGTVVNFNVSFVDVDSIALTPLATTAITAVYDFVDVPNPTSFKVLLFNSSGTRVSGAFSWSARGV
jgi:predicted phage tail protein